MREGKSFKNKQKKTKATTLQRLLSINSCLYDNMSFDKRRISVNIYHENIN